MANLIIQEDGLPRTTPAVNGEELTITAPCDCSAVTGVSIDGTEYPFYDACGNSLQSTTGLFTSGSLIRVMIDTTNTRAQILNVYTPPSDVKPYSEIINCSTNRTLSITDANKCLVCTGSITVTIPLNASVAFPIGTELEVINAGSGTVTLGNTTGVTLIAEDTTLLNIKVGGSSALKKLAEDSWHLVGALE